MRTRRASTARKALTLALIASLCAISFVRAQAQESSPEGEEQLEELEPLSDDESGGMADDACSVIASFPPEGMEGTHESRHGGTSGQSCLRRMGWRGVRS